MNSFNFDLFWKISCWFNFWSKKLKICAHFCFFLNQKFSRLEFKFENNFHLREILILLKWFKFGNYDLYGLKFLPFISWILSGSGVSTYLQTQIFWCSLMHCIICKQIILLFACGVLIMSNPFRAKKPANKLWGVVNYFHDMVIMLAVTLNFQNKNLDCIFLVNRRLII